MLTKAEHCGGTPAFYRIVIPALLAGLLATTPAAAQNAGSDPVLPVAVDQAQLIKLPDRAVTVVVGNPLIADASLQQGGLLVITGKGYGLTNLIALDRGGNTLLEKQILVQAPLQSVVVYRGVTRESYSCAPTCERRITLGDNPQSFNEILSQTVSRNAQAAAVSTK